MGRGRGSRPLDHTGRLCRSIIKFDGSGIGVLCFDLLFMLRVTLDDIEKMLDEVMPKAGYRRTIMRRINQSSPPEHDHNPRHSHGRSENLQDDQDRLLPCGESAQIDGS